MPATTPERVPRLTDGSMREGNACPDWSSAGKRNGPGVRGKICNPKTSGSAGLQSRQPAHSNVYKTKNLNGYFKNALLIKRLYPIKLSYNATVISFENIYGNIHKNNKYQH